MFKQGDLAWLPSDITLIKFDQYEESVNEWCRTKIPTHVVILNDDNKESPYHEVIYRGEKWVARKLDLYHINKEEVISNVG